MGNIIHEVLWNDCNSNKTEWNKFKLALDLSRALFLNILWLLYKKL